MPTLLPTSLAAPDWQTVLHTDLQNLPAGLDGSFGTNRRAGGTAQIAAQTDVAAVKAWLARFLATKTTFDSYRKEAERLLLWAVAARGKPLSSLTHEDLLAYRHFLADPQPAAQWVMAPGRKHARASPHWRPFAGPLSHASQRQSFVILNTLFSWLVDAGYLAGNPLSLSRQRQRKSAPRVERYLDDRAWGYVKACIQRMPRDTAREQEHHWRVRWLFSLMYLCGLRISEVVGNTMGGFFARRDRSGQVRWWLEVTGKGNKVRIVPATNELMQELAGYRVAKGLSPEPAQGEATPLLLPVGAGRQALTRSAVHGICKQVFRQAAANLHDDGGSEAAPTAALLASASAHWLRHTAGTHMAATAMDLRHVRDNLGHESLTTTSIYLHTEDDVRHAQTDARHRLDW